MKAHRLLAILAGVALLLIVTAACAAPSTPSPSPTSPAAPTTTPNTGTVKDLAPIEKAEILILESAPPQYVVFVEYGLPNGCARPGGYTVDRQGETITVKVYVTRPSDPQMMCTMIYGIDKHNIPLGKDFTSGKTYTVLVNDKSVEFTAQ